MKAARLVVLGVAIAAGGLAALLAGRSEQEPAPPPAPVVQLPTVDVLIANADIGMGSKLSAAQMQWQPWPAAAAGPTFIRKQDRPNAIEDLSGAIVRGSFVNGEPIQEARLIRADGSGYMAAILPTGMRAISTEISPETGAGGFILPNDRVDVILTRRDREAEKSSGTEVHTSETVLSNIRVLAIDQTVEDKGGQKVVVGKTATLETTPRQAETLALARQLGTLSLALRSIVDASKKSESVEEASDSRRGGVNMVRFGVTTMTTSK